MRMLQQGNTLRYGVVCTARNALAAIFVIIASAAAAFADQKTLVAFGDSLTQGFGLPADQGFVPQLQAWLTHQGVDVTVINAGVSGDTTTGGKARIDWTLAEPADAIIVALGGNDVLRALPPEDAKANLTHILTAAQDKGLEVLLVGTQAPGNYGPDYKATFEGLYPALADQFSVPLYPSFFAAFSGQADVPAELTGFIQPDGLHPNALGVQRIVDHMGPFVLALIAVSD
ncbi:MAG: arylesterase [Pseudomonadota bacterium]